MRWSLLRGICFRIIRFVVVFFPSISHNRSEKSSEIIVNRKLWKWWRSLNSNSNHHFFTIDAHFGWILDEDNGKWLELWKRNKQSKTDIPSRLFYRDLAGRYEPFLIVQFWIIMRMKVFGRQIIWKVTISFYQLLLDIFVQIFSVDLNYFVYDYIGNPNRIFWHWNL